jgi:hypothetical protein
MASVDFTHVYFFHFEVLPVVPSKEVQGGYADVCSIAAGAEAAETQALELIQLQGFRDAKRLAYLHAAQLQPSDWEELELKLLAKALQRTPSVAAQFSVWGEEREEPLLTDLPVPNDRTSQ